MKFCMLIAFAMLPFLVSAQKSTTVKKKVLVVVSSYGKNAGKARPGYEFDEFSQAWLIFKSNGIDVDVASPRGGNAEPDEFNKTKPYNKLVLEDANAMNSLRNTLPTAKVKPASYEAVYIVGGKGAMFDLPVDPALQEIIVSIYQKQQGIVAAVCHGPAAFVHVKLNDSSFLVNGKALTGFSNDEEDKFGKKWKPEFPFLLEDKLKQRGARYERSDAMLPQLTVEGRLLTGQNPFSTTLLAEEIVRALGLTPVKRELYKDERSMELVKRALNGELKWAQQEIKSNYQQHDVQLIAAYGYYKLINAKDNSTETASAIDMIELVSPWVFNETLRYETAKGYLLLKNKEKAKNLLLEILEKEPSSEKAKKLLADIK